MKSLVMSIALMSSLLLSVGTCQAAVWSDLDPVQKTIIQNIPKACLAKKCSQFDGKRWEWTTDGKGNVRVTDHYNSNKSINYSFPQNRLPVSNRLKFIAPAVTTYVGHAPITGQSSAKSSNLLAQDRTRSRNRLNNRLIATPQRVTIAGLSSTTIGQSSTDAGQYTTGAGLSSGARQLSNNAGQSSNTGHSSSRTGQSLTNTAQSTTNTGATMAGVRLADEAIVEQPSVVTGQSTVQSAASGTSVSKVSVSKKCTTGGCDITLTSSVDEQQSLGYLKWDANGQNADLITSLMHDNTLQMKAGQPVTIHLNTAVSNELQLADGTRIECMSCNGGSSILANRFTTGCDKAGETNPHSECIGNSVGCGSAATMVYGCWRFNTCGVNQCNDYALDANGQKRQSADCKASSSGQKWKCTGQQKCEAGSDGTYTSQSECLSSLACGGGGDTTERITFYCCDRSAGSCSVSVCSEGSPRYVNPTQCAAACSNVQCSAGTFKCGTGCCDSLNESCSQSYTCTRKWSCSGTCCAKSVGCKVSGSVTGVCGGDYGNYPVCCQECN